MAHSGTTAVMGTVPLLAATLVPGAEGFHSLDCCQMSLPLQAASIQSAST